MRDGSISESSEPIDVEGLMEGLRTRVAQKKAQGHYSIDELMLDRVTDEPIDSRDIERLRDLATQPPDMRVNPSNKPVIGTVVSKVKHKLIAGTSEPLLRMHSEMSDFNVGLLRYVADLSREVAALKRQMAHLASADARTGVGDDDARRLAAERSRIQLSDAVATRLAALCHATGSVLQVGVALDGPVPGVTGVSGVEGHRAPGGSDRGAGVAFGDPLTVVRSLADAGCGASIALDVVERVSLSYATALIEGLARVTADDGPVIIVGREPESPDLVVDVVSDGGFPRRAVPADVVAREMEAAGLREVEIEHTDRDAQPAPPTSRGSRHFIVHARA